MKKTLTGLAMILALSTPASALDKTNVITSSAREYVESIQSKLSNYNLIGVHIRNNASDTVGEIKKTGKYRQCQDYLIQEAPKNTEAIVDYKEFGNEYIFSCSGTALVKKTKK